MKADLINELARLRDELRNVSNKIDNALNAVTEEQNKPAPMQNPSAAATFVPLTEPEEEFFRNWSISPAKPAFTAWESSFLDSVLQRNSSSQVIKLTTKQYDSFIKIYAKHVASI